MRVHRRVAAFVTAAYGIELPLGVQIGRRLALPHPQGVVFGYGSCIGDDCMVRHNVTLGAASHERDGMPTVGDRVQFGPGSIVMGAVEVGDDVRIGPGAVVISDVPAGSRVLAPVATVVPPRTVSDPVRPDPLRPTAPVHGTGD
jgi:serine O-acetyltransferase